MGIAGVLPLLAPATRRVNFWTELRDSCVGIDSSVWMHQLALKYCEDVTGDGPRSWLRSSSSLCSRSRAVNPSLAVIPAIYRR